MSRLTATRALAAFLVFALLVLGGFASAQSIAHESHHAHHQKGTHSTTLCSWMCAAGQALDGVGAPALIEWSPVTSFHHSLFLFVPQVALDNTTSRGPPALSTI